MPSEDGLFLASAEEMTPLLEISGVLRPPNSPVSLLFEVLMTVDGTLADILDVTDNEIQNALGTTAQELTGDWALQQTSFLPGQGRMPPTQVLGQAAYDVGNIMGLKYLSSKNLARGVSIVVFTGRLVRGRSYLELFNKQQGALQQRLP